jgi:hypothetical protein
VCTLIILHHPDHEWPLVVAANRDEAVDRPWRPPAHHWPERPSVIGGLDLEAGGSWLVLTKAGLVAAVLNGPASRGPAPGYRSRGELVLETSDHISAEGAVAALGDLDSSAFRPFSLVVADAAQAWLLRNFQTGDDDGRTLDRVHVTRLPDGLTMLTTTGIPNDMTHARIRDYLPRFAAHEAPQPHLSSSQTWSAWETLMGSRHAAPDAGPRGAMSLIGPGRYGTVSSSIIAVPAHSALGARRVPPIWRFAGGPPHNSAFADLDLSTHQPG